MIERILHMADDVLFIGTFIYTLYLLILAIASHLRKSSKYPKSKKFNKILVLIPLNSTFPEDEYPDYEVITYTDRTKAIQGIDASKYDIAVLLGTTVRTSPKFLTKINNAFSAGVKAAQLHGIQVDRSSFSRKLQSIKEEVGNSLYQKGNIQIGYSGALTGPDIAIEMKWLKRNQKSLVKNLENKLLRQQIDIEYLEEVCVYRDAYEPHWFNPKRLKVISNIISIFFYGSWSYINRCIQWLLPSPYFFLIVTSIWTALIIAFNWKESLKWLMLLFILLTTISLAIPDYLVEDKKKKKS